MTKPTHRPVRLKDYRPPTHLVDTVHMTFWLDVEQTRVRTKLSLRPNPAGEATGRLTLHGTMFEVESLSLNGAPLASSAYVRDDETLTLLDPPTTAFEFDCITRLNPSSNRALQGLYLTRGVYCTQCEAEGFRRITYMLDRPDVLARYTVRIEANQHDAPVLLSNGNLVERGRGRDGQHYAVWSDPHPKPSYLFALVAGDLGSIASDFTTKSGRRVDLRIYVEHGKEPRAAWAMDCLKRAMKWDEERFGLEYDLDQFNIVAVSDFNMGAMENKGLNVFNDRLILASAETATDAAFEAIESVVAHEYFHNWTGNRITCRDWFQLCLKEGLTVFRDQEFSSDARSRTVQRISDVRHLKAVQFPEDAGPLAHPVRPESYVEINNFYTATVYEKGAELVRMLECMLGATHFAAGLQHYFEHHDGQAATVEDFIACFEAVSGHNLQSFRLWYAQAGTPKLNCRATYDATQKTLELSFSQSFLGDTATSHRKAVPIPVRLGLVGRDGRDLPLTLADGTMLLDGVAVVTKAQQVFRFRDIATRPVASLLRGFSAPVRLAVDLTDAELSFLAANDSDLFNRWQAGQHLAMRTLLQIYASLKDGKRTSRGLAFANALGQAINGPGLDPAYKAELLKLPSIADVMQEIGTDVDPAVAAKSIKILTRKVALALGEPLERLYRAARASGPYSPDAASAGKRALRNVTLSLLASRQSKADIERIADHYFSATNMTDQAHALGLLTHIESPQRTAAFDHFLEKWKDDDLVVDVWFAARAQSMRSGAIDEVRALLQHPQFKLTTPNKVRALIGTFAVGNLIHFHAPNGAGYAFVTDQVLAIDRFNPQVASRLVSSFRSWRSLEPGRQARAQEHLRRLSETPQLSRDVHEIVSKMWDARTDD